jgi:hypothetical protein
LHLISDGAAVDHTIVAGTQRNCIEHAIHEIPSTQNAMDVRFSFGIVLSIFQAYAIATNEHALASPGGATTGGGKG